MNPTPPETQSLVDELIAVLDEQISMLELRQSQLETLTDAIAERCEEALGRLLNEIEQTQRYQETADVKLRAIRRTLGEFYHCDAEKIKLSILAQHMDQSDRLAVEYRRQQIILLIGTLRGKHAQAVAQLVESARVNNMMLESLFPSNETVTTYDAFGAESWKSGAALVDSEF